MIKGILFDKDGTLIDFYSVWGEAAYTVAGRLCDNHGMPEAQEEVLKSLGVENGRADPEGALAWKSYAGIAEDLAPMLGMALDVEGLTKEVARDFFEEVAMKRTEYPTFTDLPRMMEALRRQDIRIGLATTDEPLSTQICMEILKIEGFVSFWGTAGKGLPEKPDGRLIRLAAEEWRIEPYEIAVVGDTPNDMRFAAAGGAVGIAVLSGTGGRKTLEPLSDYMIDSVDDLSGLIEKINFGEEEENGGNKAYACV